MVMHCVSSSNDISNNLSFKFENFLLEDYLIV